MNLIFDTAMLKHHRVDYDKRVDTRGAGRRANAGYTITLVTIAILAVSLLSSFNAQS